MAKRKEFPPMLCLAFLLLYSGSWFSCAGTPSDYNSVVLNASSLKITAGGVVKITATVPRDSSNMGVNWTSTAPPAAGTFAVTDAFHATYTAPNTVTTQFTVDVTAVSIALPTEMKTITITVQPPPPLNIKITALPNAVIGVPYTAGTKFQASGGVSPYTWALAAGAFPPGLTLNPDGSITGTPTGTGVFNAFTVTATDSETPPMTATSTAGQFSITVTNVFVGNYAFELSGFNSSGAVVVAGSFKSDGVNTITGGVEDFNSIAPNSYRNSTFTGTYTINANGQGQLIFSSLAGSPTYNFAVDSGGLHGRMVEFDATGVRGSGELAQQTTATCGSQTMSGAGPVGADFVIGFSGAEGNFTGTTPGPFAAAGRFTVEVPPGPSTPGTLDNGELDASVPGGTTITPDTSFSGTYQTTTQASRCTMTTNSTTSLTSQTFSVYPIASTAGLLTEAFIVETDQVSQTAPFVSAGKLIHQSGYPFTPPIQTFPSTSVGGLSGPVIPQGGNAYVPFAAVAALQGTGGTAFTLSVVENAGGTVASALGAAAIGSNFNSGDMYGRIDTQLGQNPGVIAPAFYVINNNEALCLLENMNAPVLGIFETQTKGGSANFSSSTIAGTLVQGTSAPATTALQNFSGVVTLTSTTTTAGTVTGIEDLSTTASNTPGLGTTGTYALTASGPTDGSGTLSLTQAAPPPPFNGAFFIVSPTKAVMITTTNGDVNPVLVIYGDQADDFGIN
jgi:large repetitive protein